MYGLDDSPIDKSKLLSDLIIWEGDVPFVYDDATGKPIVKGSVVVGNPTIGIGRLCTAARGLSPSERRTLASNDIDLCIAQAESQPWWRLVAGCEPRARAFVALGINPGFGSLARFSRAMDAAMRSDWATCAAELRNSLWHRQTGRRADTIATMIETGLECPL